MSVMLRVLLVEHLEDDALLIIRHLSKHGYEPDYVRVQTRERLVEELCSRQWDVVLCDYKMPGFSAPEALQTVQELGLDVPFIVVSGTVGEDIAVECMRAGAADFLSKFDLRRLAPAIAREVRDAEHRRARRSAESALRRSAENARKIIAASMDGMVIVDTGGIVRFANPTAVNMLGQTLERLIGRPFDIPVAVGRESQIDLTDRVGKPLVVESSFSSCSGKTRLHTL
ncbi:MAG: response regulator [Chloroflexota bacterium]